jgi:phosphatidylglycerol---prolipoprotein diacylglyceryl transferase
VTIDIDPVIGRLGPLEFRWYGIIMMVAVAVGLVILSRQLERRGISQNHAWGIAIIAVPSGVIGARLFHVFENMGYYWEHPGEIFGTQLVGLAIYGVITGGLIGLLVYCRWKKLPVLKVLDSTAIAFPAAQIVGKFANIINGDTWGNPTSLPWGFTYTNPNAFIPDEFLGVATHPNPVYEQLWLLVIVGILFYAIPRLKVDGTAILLYLGLYSVGRFFLSYFRVNKILFLGLREAQVVALVVIVLAIPAAVYLVWRARRIRHEGPPGAGPFGDDAVADGPRAE